MCLFAPERTFTERLHCQIRNCRVHHATLRRSGRSRGFNGANASEPRAVIIGTSRRDPSPPARPAALQAHSSRRQRIAESYRGSFFRSRVFSGCTARRSAGASRCWSGSPVLFAIWANSRIFRPHSGFATWEATRERSKRTVIKPTASAVRPRAV